MKNLSSTFFSRSINSRETKNNDNPRGKLRGFGKVLDKLGLLYVGILFLGVIAFIVLRLPNQTKNQTPIQQKSSTNVSYQSQTDEKGAVIVEVTPLSLTRGENASFTVTLTTHSGEPVYDILATSRLTDDKGNTYKALSWTGGEGGHHVSGLLTFSNLSPQAKSVTLTIPGIDKQDRIFEWEFK